MDLRSYIQAQKHFKAESDFEAEVVHKYLQES